MCFTLCDRLGGVIDYDDTHDWPRGLFARSLS